MSGAGPQKPPHFSQAFKPKCEHTPRPHGLPFPQRFDRAVPTTTLSQVDVGQAQSAVTAARVTKTRIEVLASRAAPMGAGMVDRGLVGCGMIAADPAEGGGVGGAGCFGATSGSAQVILPGRFEFL